MIQLIITRKCNFLCKHCMYACDKNGGHMASDVFDRALDYVKQAADVDVMGGEPTLHPHFIERVKTLAFHVLGMRIATNGSWVHTPESKGILKALELVSSMLSGKLLVRLSTDKWHREFINKEALRAASYQLREKNIRVIEAEDDTPYPLGRASQEFSSAYNLSAAAGMLDSPAECTKGDYNVLNNLSIDINGDASPCPFHQAICGNIMRSPINEILKSAESMMKSIRRNSPRHKDCVSCSKRRCM